MRATAPSVQYAPVKIAPETWVIQQTHGEGTAPVAVHINSMVITGAEPVLIDTGTPANRERWLADAWSIVDPADVRWVFLTHDDVDHYGNLEQVLDACPEATLVTTFFQHERLACLLDLPPHRTRWINHGERLDVGDRDLVAVRPPLYDNPTSRGVFDPTTGVYWAVDCFGTAVPHGMAFLDELDPAMWSESFADMQRLLAPWLTLVDEAAYQRSIDALAALGATVIASGHTPTITGDHVGRAIEALRRLPALGPVTEPTQFDLDALLAGAAGTA
jgi:flavorubredoxin